MNKQWLLGNWFYEWVLASDIGTLSTIPHWFSPRVYPFVGKCSVYKSIDQGQINAMYGQFGAHEYHSAVFLGQEDGYPKSTTGTIHLKGW